MPALERRVLDIYAIAVAEAVPSAKDGILAKLSDEAATDSES